MSHLPTLPPVPGNLPGMEQLQFSLGGAAAGAGLFGAVPGAGAARYQAAGYPGLDPALAAALGLDCGGLQALAAAGAVGLGAALATDGAGLHAASLAALQGLSAQAAEVSSSSSHGPKRTRRPPPARAREARSPAGS
ncbi:unnamed protein product [Prorocentrum cordatum]|uniref:Uncharacterized protein n=1 Tax=Prorocentrum cordatum TaxID=2364126 RepID=A0ABN9UD97_9DINO|nr:unnamed protein product [Polarella glacialis]